ncbi:hypothetical protein GCM10010329_03000 [Streptomyces spiroverticillatus]|uniref:Uncharacterized protein n=1 Tax=Streptomyces finlayi TaxID=67296 RepID=A0A918WSF7_9ACTN|nr:hypothetical protein [Streptomyces finlayi]GGZ86550.1 hypothetical protein GCM10010329_03000 [Streptomyces spiroverticillatus]GHC78067.1 hypothetical protein GCM10010334_02980 [Streptomyces finlayi]
MALLLLTSCTKDDPTSTEGLDPFLSTYVQLLNASDEPGLVRHLAAHPSGDKDAAARIAEFGGQGWKVEWTKSSEFPGVWNVKLRGTRTPGSTPVNVSEVVVREDGEWSFAPMPGVVPKPPNAADTTRPE